MTALILKDIATMKKTLMSTLVICFAVLSQNICHKVDLK